MLLTEQQYLHAIDLLRCPEKKDLFLVELQQWFYQHYQIHLYAYFYDLTHEHITRLKLIVWSDEQHFVRQKSQKDIQEYWTYLTQKYHQDWISKPEIITYDTLKDEIQKRILKQTSDLIQNIYYPEIWKIKIIFDQVHIFFETDEQCQISKRLGINDQINQKILEIVQPYDEFHVFDDSFSCVFTSHQTLDEKYQGSMFLYTR